MHSSCIQVGYLCHLHVSISPARISNMYKEWARREWRMKECVETGSASTVTSWADVNELDATHLEKPTRAASKQEFVHQVWTTRICIVSTQSCATVNIQMTMCVMCALLMIPSPFLDTEASKREGTHHTHAHWRMNLGGVGGGGHGVKENALRIQIYVPFYSYHLDFPR